MSASVDLDRLRATLGQPELTRLLDALQKRLALGRPLTGCLTLATASPAERSAADALLGRNATRGDSLRIDLDFLSESLCAAGLCTSLREAVECLRGPVRNRQAEASSLAASWAGLRAQAHGQFVRWPALAPWIGDLFDSGLLKRLTAGPSQASALLDELDLVVHALPRRADPIAVFAARLFGDAHALDPGSTRATLAVRAAALLGNVDFEEDAEGRRSAWTSVGVLCDELSAPVLTFNLPAVGDTPLARLVRNATQAAEPLHLSLRLLLRYPLSSDVGSAGVVISICENPSLVAQAATTLGGACEPLVCVNGQFATPALILMRQLRESGARLRYHGDFDSGGVAIARRVFAESGASPWRYSAADYDLAPKGKPISGIVGSTPWSPELARKMTLAGRAVHEEAIADLLLGDLVRDTPSRVVTLQNPG
jgi:uncharacterized protein (TIGR02679 family)